MRKGTTYLFGVAILLACVCNVLHAMPPDGRITGQEQSSSQKPSPPPDSAQSAASEEKLTLSDQISQGVLEPLRTGLKTQDIQQILAVFDKNELPNYNDLEQELHAFVQQYAEVRFRYQLLQATAQNDHASAIVQVDMDAMPYDITQIVARRSVQMRLQLKLEPKGWKVTSFSPSDFFTMAYNQQGVTR